MRNFLNAIVLSDGEVLTAHECYTDHAELIALYDLNEARGPHFVKVVFNPSCLERAWDVYGYRLQILGPRPVWFGRKAEEKTCARLRARVAGMLVHSKVPVLKPGTYILAPGAQVTEASSCYIMAMTGTSFINNLHNSRVDIMVDNCVVNDVSNSHIGEMYGRSEVTLLRGSSKVALLHDDCSVVDMQGISQVGALMGRSQVSSMCQASTILHMFDESHVTRLGDSSVIGTMLGQSCVALMTDSSCVRSMFDRSQVMMMNQRSVVIRMSGRSRAVILQDASRVLETYEDAKVGHPENIRDNATVSGEARVSSQPSEP